MFSPTHKEVLRNQLTFRMIWFVMQIKENKSMTDFKRARELLHEFKGDSYPFGPGILPDFFFWYPPVRL